MPVSYVDRVKSHLADERGASFRQGGQSVALCYPSPYRTAMSSLGFQQIYRIIRESGDFSPERVFLPDEDVHPPSPPAVSYESLRPLSEFSILAVSVAYELELAGLVSLLEGSRIPALRTERSEQHPFVLAGGPLTFSNPLPLGAYVDAIVLGEAEEIVLPVLRAIAAAPSKAVALEQLATMPHVYVPGIHPEVLRPIAKCEDERLPARSCIATPNTELSNMFLIESERGCSRGCTYCVMRRSTNGGMRVVSKERIFELIPEDAMKVGLVGAAVSDHPKIAEIVRTLAEQGKGVGLSSLRPDRLNDEFVGALALAGYKTLTTAMDGPSDRLREMLERRARIRHLEKAAELARAHKMRTLKLYLMIGLPTETDDDILECAEFVRTLSRTIPVALGVAPFCSKRNTPLDARPFAGVGVVEARLRLLRKSLAGRGEVRATSARWAWAEYVLAQGGEREGVAVRDAVKGGGRFADYKAAFGLLGHDPEAKAKAARLPVL